jgi:hypothetical protein
MVSILSMFTELLVCLTPLLQSPPPLDGPKIADPKIVAGGNPSIADFDLDGIPDVAVTNGFLQAVSGPFVVLRLDGKGEMVGRDVGPMSNVPFALYKASAAADVDRDGLVDLVTANSQGQVEVFANGGPSRLRATGQRFFPPAVIGDLSGQLLGTKSLTFSVMFFADLDGDGYEDLVLSGQVERLFLPVQPAGLHVYFGDGSGQFPIREFFPTELVTAGRAADFDGDGKLEIVLLTAKGRVLHFRCLGKSLVQSVAHVLPFSWGVTAMDAGDFDRDGTADYAFAGSSGGGMIAAVTGTRTSAPGTVLMLDVPRGDGPDEITSLRFFDLDGDHKLDLVAVQSFGTRAKARLMWYRGWGDGTFDPAGVRELPGLVSFLDGTPVPDQFVATDLNRDGNPELVLNSLLMGQNVPPQVAVFTNWSRSYGLVELRGEGAKGSCGLAPRIGVAGGLPLPGQKDFAITLTDATGGGALGALLLGTKEVEIKVGELTFYTVPLFVTMHRTRGEGQGGGFAIVPCPIPDDRSLVGTSLHFQWLVTDAGLSRSIPVTTSNAVRVVVGER